MKSLINNRYQELDALRGIAALMVVLFHYSMNREETYFLFKFGVAGVDLFFLISGFVIMMSIMKVEKGYQFVINRFSRLYPTYWVVVTFTLIVYVLTRHYMYGDPLDVYWKLYFANMTMFQYYLNFPDIDGPYWSMIVEMVFYITMLVIFYAKALRYTIRIFTFLTVLTTVLSQFYWEDHFTQDFFEYFALIHFIPLFTAGIVFYRMYTEQKTWKEYTLIAFCFGCQALLFTYTGRSRIFITQPEYIVTIAIFFVAFLLFVHGKLRFIVNPVTLFLGKISFALYLVHQFVSIDLIIPLLIKKGVSFYVAAFCIALPVAIGLGTLITYAVEIPGSKKLKQLLYSLHGKVFRKSAGN